MSLVNALRFSKFDGAMISDEEYWMYERRRVFFRDNIHNLIKPAMSNKYDIELFYGGIGDPYLHHEIINKAKKKIAVFFETNTLPQGKGYPIYELSKEVMNIVHATVRDRIEQKLRLLYGFGVDDFHRGYFIQNGKKYEIHQESVKKQVYNLITWSDKNNTVKSIFESRALIMGYDKEGGVQLFYVNIENQVLSFNSGDYDTIGKGIYGAGHVFANYTLQKTMDKRIKGCSRVEGMVTLIDSALTAAQTYNQVGGYFNIIYVNYKKDSKQRIQHIQGDRAKLATEIVAAMKKTSYPFGTAIIL